MRQAVGCNDLYKGAFHAKSDNKNHTHGKCRTSRLQAFLSTGSGLYKNRRALACRRNSGHGERPAHSVFYSILLIIVRNICPLVKRKTGCPAEHFVHMADLCRKNPGASAYTGAHSASLFQIHPPQAHPARGVRPYSGPDTPPRCRTLARMDRST